MPLEFDCPHCSHHYRVADTNAGKRFACKQCGQPVQVPGPQARVAPAPAPAPRPAVPGRSPSAPRAVAPRPAAAQAAPAPYGQQAPEGPKSRAPNYVFLGGAVAMTLGFFLPWISIDLVIVKMNWGGYELPGKFMEFVGLAEKMTDPGTPEYQQIQDIKGRGTFLYSMYLIPLLCLAAGIEELMAFKKARNFWWLRAIAAASPIIAFITVMIAFSGLSEPGGGASSGGGSGGGDSSMLFKILGFGVWISLLGFIAATAGIFTSPKPKSAQPAMVRRPRPPGGPRPAVAAGGASPRPQAGPRQPAGPRPPVRGGPKLPRPQR